ncbi:type VII secretion protein EccCb [Thermocrispum agreste]|uniref:type VII secretion protein EccCb n=1 Tax=Thermocrispum agreste TaxID=37925 RepID=UPI0006881DA9|nr:type VII secretion protein EccCb [Thermocrispum agreste]
MHLVVTTNRWSDVHSALRDQFGTRLELRLGDKIDSMINMRKAGEIPQIPGRGMTPDLKHFLSGVPRIDGRCTDQGLAEATRELTEAVAESWRADRAPAVRMLPTVLPTVLPAEQLPPPTMPGPRIPLGLGELDLQPVWHDFGTKPHLTIVGDSGSGKTAALRLIIRSIVAACSPEQAQILLVDPRRGLIDVVPEAYRRGVAVSAPAAEDQVAELTGELRRRVPGSDISPARLRKRDWWSGPEMFVVIDDYDLLLGHASGPFGAMIELIPQASDIGFHMVMARAAAGSSRTTMEPVTRRLQESNTPELALSMPPNEMPLLNGQRGKQLPPGRAVLVTRRGGVGLQIGWTEEPA